MRSYLGSVLAVVVVILLAGAGTFELAEAGINPNVRNFGDALWWALVTMTTVGYGDIFPVTSLGRMIGAVMMITGIGTLGISTAAIAAYLIRFNSLDLMRARRMSGHVVICGLGAPGLLLVQAFRAQGRQVVALEKDEANPRLAAARDAGAVVLVGDGSRPEVLQRARLDRAKHVIVVCGSDVDNTQVTAQANGLPRRAGSSLHCATQIVDPELWYALRTWEFATPGEFRLEFFNLSELGAQALLARHPPARPADKGAPRVLLVGAGPVGHHLIRHMVRRWRDEPTAAGETLKVTLVDKHPEPVFEHLSYRHPEMRGRAEITPLAIDPRSSQFQRGAFLFDEHGHCAITQAYVCLEDEGEALSTALLLVNHLRRFHVPVVVQMSQEVGLAALLGTFRAGEDAAPEHLSVFSLMQETCRPELVLEGTNEMLARALHQDYLDHLPPGAHNAGAVPWAQLPAEMQEANRSEAGHIAARLRAIHVHLVPLTALEAERFAFTPAEVEHLATLEHERWMAERQAAGWTYGPRDAVKKTNPNLVPWNKLDSAVQESNRQAVRRLPEFLGRAGFAPRRSA